MISPPGARSRLPRTGMSILPRTGPRSEATRILRGGPGGQHARPLRRNLRAQVRRRRRGIGPWIVSRDEVADPFELLMYSRLDGEQKDRRTPAVISCGPRIWSPISRAG